MRDLLLTLLSPAGVIALPGLGLMFELQNTSKVPRLHEKPAAVQYRQRCARFTGRFPVANWRVSSKADNLETPKQS
jgi:hypothetical protein